MGLKTGFVHSYRLICHIMFMFNLTNDGCIEYFITYMWYQSFTWKSHSNSDRREISVDNTAIFERGVYKASDNTEVDVTKEVEAANEGQVIYLDGAHAFNISDGVCGRGGTLELTGETSIGAAYRLIVNDSIKDTVILNFASPVWPGGGYRTGDIAQEEDLCRCSLLFNFIVQATEMYDVPPDEVLYTDNMIVTPNVPVIRDDTYALLPNMVTASFITCAAPKAYRWTDDMEILNAALEQRIRKIIMCAIEHKYEAIVLGAFGCGAFRCDVGAVSKMFKKILIDEGLRQYFTKITFAVHSDREYMPNAFREAFGELLP